jgi:hypothetical protein
LGPQLFREFEAAQTSLFPGIAILLALIQALGVPIYFDNNSEDQQPFLCLTIFEYSTLKTAKAYT